MIKILLWTLLSLAVAALNFRLLNLNNERERSRRLLIKSALLTNKLGNIGDKFFVEFVDAVKMKTDKMTKLLIVPIGGLEYSPKVLEILAKALQRFAQPPTSKSQSQPKESGSDSSKDITWNSEFLWSLRNLSAAEQEAKLKASTTEYPFAMHFKYVKRLKSIQESYIEATEINSKLQKFLIEIENTLPKIESVEEISNDQKKLENICNQFQNLNLEDETVDNSIKPPALSAAEKTWTDAWADFKQQTLDLGIICQKLTSGVQGVSENLANIKNLIQKSNNSPDVNNKKTETVGTSTEEEKSIEKPMNDLKAKLQEWATPTSDLINKINSLITILDSKIQTLQETTGIPAEGSNLVPPAKDEPKENLTSIDSLENLANSM